MSKHLYKYVGPSYLDKVFSDKDHVTLKCSYPKDFNDPYELFLTIDFNERPEVLAFYADAVGEIPQLPTTCFSRSPAVIPMWAHYAQNLQGLCIEFDEELLSSYFPESGFGDVDYREKPEESLNELLCRAHVTAKARHMHFFLSGVFRAAYYTKATYWNYEQERRMIVDEDETRTSDELILIDVPKECIKSLICGPRASEETVSTLREKAKKFRCFYFQLNIGKTSLRPFFVDLNGDPFIFNGTDIEQSDQFCEVCKEPLFNDDEKCSWCQIDEHDMHNASSRNPYRILERYGLLKSYIEGARVIDEEIMEGDA
jgi:hypothetical protein